MTNSLIRYVLVYVLLSFIEQSCTQDPTLVSGHVLYRHGDRTPVTTFPTDPVKPSEWPNGYGQLTTLGIEEQHRLGQFIRNRYATLLSANYTPSEIVVRSTDVDRTLMSAQSNLIGLYPVLDPAVAIVPIQPIPIHTVSIDLDFLLGQNNCPRYDQIEEEINQGPDMQALDKFYQPFFEKLEHWTNLSNITVYDAWEIADTIFVENRYNRTPSWADAAVQKNLSDINDLAFHYLFANNDSQRIRGGPSIQDMWLNMNKTVHNETYKKVKMYSAHDTTVSPALAFLGINYPHQPQYASALFVDLYKQNSSYFVRVEYLNKTDSSVSYPYPLNGCSSVNCSFNDFTTIYQPRFPASADVECQRHIPPQTTSPKPTPADDSGKLMTVLIIMIVALIGILFAMFLYLYLRRKEPELLLQRGEQSTVDA